MTTRKTTPLSALALALAAGSWTGCDDGYDHDHEQRLDGGVDVAAVPDAAGPKLDTNTETDAAALDAVATDTGADGTPTAATSTLGRLLVGDGDPETPRFWVIDLDDGKTLASFPALGNVGAYASSHRSGLAWARQSTANITELVTSGLTVVDGRLQKGAPEVLSRSFVGARPTHWVSHDDWVVIFNDGDGSFDFALESSILSGRPLMRRGHSNKAHHGVAVISHGNLFTSLAAVEEGSSARVGVSQRRLATPDVAVTPKGVDPTNACPALHGEASNEEIVAFGCSDGVLMAQRKDGDFEFRKLALPAGAPGGIGTSRAKDGVARLVAWGGAWTSRFAVITYRDANPNWTTVDTGVVHLGGFFEEGSSSRFVALGADGSVRAYDAMTAAAVGTPLSVVPAWSGMGLRPVLAVAEGYAFVADPRDGKVTEVNLATWQKGRTFSVGGRPNSVAAFGRWDNR